eukprot:scaffold1832_cov362-Prasinococcus_capsulatus_cf.AAC.2
MMPPAVRSMRPGARPAARRHCLAGTERARRARCTSGRDGKSLAREPRGACTPPSLGSAGVACCRRRCIVQGSGRDKRKKKKPSQPGQGQEKTERKTQKAEAKKGRREERKTLGGEGTARPAVPLCCSSTACPSRTSGISSADTLGRCVASCS